MIRRERSRSTSWRLRITGVELLNSSAISWASLNDVGATVRGLALVAGTGRTTDGRGRTTGAPVDRPLSIEDCGGRVRTVPVTWTSDGSCACGVPGRTGPA